MSRSAVSGAAGNARPADRVAILGLGLMGGSLALAIKRTAPATKVCVYARRAETRGLAAKLRAADEIHDNPRAACESADIVVVCLPVLSSIELLKQCRGVFRPDAVVTDVGSTKLEVMKRLPRICRPAVFIGSHPIAGSERSGLESAVPDLYRNAVVVLTPPPRGDANALNRLSRFWTALGSRPAVMSAAAHDSMIAKTSHLPHIVAALLVQRVAPFAGAYALCAGGFRDMTRIAEGSPGMWREIIATNTAPLAAELKAFRGAAAALEKMIRARKFVKVERYLARVRAAKLKLGGRKP